MFTYGLIAGLALIMDGRLRWIALVPPSLLLVGIALISVGNHMQGWGWLRKRRSS